MSSCLIERAITDAQFHGKALLKFISANDVGKTGSHQCGFYLPKASWRHYTKNRPQPGEKLKENVKITWQDGLVTKSVITWYGQKTRSEYRLTKFGRDFPWLNQDNVGSLLILIPTAPADFLAYVADTDDDIEEVLSTFGLSGLEESWAFYDGSKDPMVEDSDTCVNRNFAAFVALIKKLPATKIFAATTFRTLKQCFSSFSGENSDSRLMKLLDYEYRLFKMAERRVFSRVLTSPFKSIDHFIKTASSITNTRKVRAGASLENHVQTILREASIPFVPHPRIDNTTPDIIIPSLDAYLNTSYPAEKLFMLALKRTCKDRWRQVTREAPKIHVKHLLTVQQGISQNQLDEISRAGISLVVPSSMQIHYPKSARSGILSVEGFIRHIKNALNV
jgi:type II restriction enzyme